MSPPTTVDTVVTPTCRTYDPASPLSSSLPSSPATGAPGASSMTATSTIASASGSHRLLESQHNSSASRSKSHSPHHAPDVNADDRVVGLSSQRQLKQLERLATFQSHELQPVVSAVAAGKRPASTVPHPGEDNDGGNTSSATTESAAATIRPRRSVPSLHENQISSNSRARSAHTSPTRRWRRSRSGLGQEDASSSHGNEVSGRDESHAIPDPASIPTTIQSKATARAPAADQRTSSQINRCPSMRRHRSSGRSAAHSSSTRGMSSYSRRPHSRTPEMDNLTSSDEEGADASRFARSRRASLERDRRRGVQMLLAAGKLDIKLPSPTVAHLDGLDHFGDEASPSASTSASATPTTLGDDCECDCPEHSGMLGHGPPTDYFDRLKPSVATATAATTAAAAQGDLRLSHPSPPLVDHVQDSPAAVFDLADDEEEPPAAPLSAATLSAALERRVSRSRAQSASDAALRKPENVRSVPSSRRPSHPESSCLGPAISSSVPNRSSTILGFAPISPRRRAKAQNQHHHRMLSLAQLGSELDTNNAFDLLASSSLDSVEDLIKVEEVEWAADPEAKLDQIGSNTGSGSNVETRASVVSVRSSERGDNLPSIKASSGPTVAAVEASSLLEAEEQEEQQPPCSSTPEALPTSASPSKTAPGDQLSVRSESSNASSVGYQERLSQLQSQLQARLWASERVPQSLSQHRQQSASSSSLSSSLSSNAEQQNQSGLLASSWRQIARLPNLLFPRGRAEEADPSATSAATTSSDLPTTRVVPPSPTLPRSSATSIHDISETSTVDAADESSTENAHAQLNVRGRHPFVGARGVIDPFEGDRDPGAYITGLGHRIDPDVELSSVVHLHSFRSRSRSVDARSKAAQSSRRSGASERHHRIDSDDRHAASDSEPSLEAGKSVSSSVASGIVDKTLPHLDLSVSAGVERASDGSGGSSGSGSGSATKLDAAHKSRTPSEQSKTRPLFTFGADDEEAEQDDADAENASHAKAGNQAPLTSPEDPRSSPSPRKQPPVVCEDGFTMVTHKHDSPRCSRPAAEAPVPQDFSAFGNQPFSEDSSSDVDRSRAEDSGSDTVAGHQGRRRGTRDDEGSSSSGGDERARGRRGRGRGRSGHAPREESPPAAATRSRQCAVGLFSGKTRRREASNEMEPSGNSSSSMRLIRSSPNLSYAHVAATPQVSRRSSRDASNNNSSATSTTSNRAMGERGRGGSVKVTSSSFSESEHPPNSLPRSTSASNLELLARKPAMMSAAALAAGSTMPALPAGRASSQPPGSSSSSSSSSSNGAIGGNSGTASNEVNGSTPSSASSARPNLLSNSAHLLMLSLELEMMRAQKISAPLKVRWARQRAIVQPAAIANGNDNGNPAVKTDIIDAIDPSAPPGQVGEQGGDIVAPTAPPPPSMPVALDATYDEDNKQHQHEPHQLVQTLAFRPRRASRLRNVFTAQSA
ncbi:unnamed protein product [Jaminaea pallidilutea]